MNLSCPRCATRYTVADDRLRGRSARLRCKKCQAGLRVYWDGESLQISVEEAAGAEAAAPARSPTPEASVVAAAARASRGPGPTSDPGSKRVLVFETDRNLARELTDGFARIRCATIVVDDLKLGFDEAAQRRPDLILVSAEFPRINGFAICNKLKRDPALKDVPLVIMSADATEETFAKHGKLATSAEAYVKKPFSFEALLARVGASFDSTPPEADTTDAAADVDAAVASALPGSEAGSSTMRVVCSGCLATFQVDPRRVPPEGRQLRCPKCGASFPVLPLGRPSPVFFSYRRDDAAWAAERIRDHLALALGADPVSDDTLVASTGTDLRGLAETVLEPCKLVLVVIGERWLTEQGPSRERRLHRATDPVRMALVVALRKGLQVVPILIGDTPLPGPDDLPDVLRDLAYRGALRVRPDPDFRGDIGQLIAKVKGIVGAPPPRSSRPERPRSSELAPAAGGAPGAAQVVEELLVDADA